MIAVLKQDATIDQREHLISWLKEQGLDVHISVGREHTVLGLVGDTGKIDVELLQSLSIVESVKIISEPFKKVNRKFHPDNSVIDVPDCDVRIGDGSCVLIAGPAVIESREQLMSIARKVKEAGASVLHGDAFKPRTSPYAFQGLGREGIDILLEVKRETGLPVMSEIVNTNHIALYEDVDIIQVSSRSMQNYELLKELGTLRKPVLLKRGAANTLKELLMSAEYIMDGGNESIILCERGIRTWDFSDGAARNTLDISSVPALHEMTHLPVIVDPSHATGVASMVEPMALAAAACGADGLMIEVHDDPLHALCDGAQALTPEQFSAAAEKVRRVRSVLF
ncbi:MAG: 3-deoxy-7-phosphoheptulonate synthase [Lachnospiraceae bacterium]|nr:3-deoxy-7-phosphoheptulonate synthase [Lachnospiraceae bacterium]MBQ2040823.1 3-deoxy-7-phosphoheptulonate synthase [Lachnospiraceae bacterium]